MLSNVPRPTVFAHRGSSLHAPENTLSAFELAIQHQADAIEFDVKLTKDQHVIVIHDQTLDRTTGRSGRVRDTTLADIKNLEAGSHFSESFRGEPIPSLGEVFEKIGTCIYYNIELTNYASPLDPLPELVADQVKTHKLETHILVSSFNPFALIRIRRKLPQIPIALLALPGRNGAVSRAVLYSLLRCQALHPEVRDTNLTLINKIHRRHCSINVYTVNSEAEMRRLFSLGVDGIFTDDPPKARQVLASVSRL